MFAVGRLQGIVQHGLCKTVVGIYDSRYFSCGPTHIHVKDISNETFKYLSP